MPGSVETLFPPLRTFGACMAGGPAHRQVSERLSLVAETSEGAGSALEGSENLQKCGRFPVARKQRWGIRTPFSE